MDNLLASKQARNLQIEGLRGISILIIVLFHIFDRYQQLYLGQEIKWMNFWGSLGVTSFFLISGLFAVDQKTDEQGIRIGLRGFVKRFLRLWPTYLLAIIIIFCVTHVVPLDGRTVSFSDFMANTVFVNRYIGIPYVDGSHWYLSTLVTMFLIISVFHIFGIQKKPLSYLIWIVVEVMIDKVFHTGDMYPVGGAFIAAFCIGIAIMHLNKMECEESRLNKALWISIVPLGIAELLIVRGLGAATEVVVCIIMVYLCVKGKLPFLGIKPLVFVGTISYPLYLIHQNLSFVIQNLISEINGYSLLCPTIAFLLLFGIAVGIYYVFEKPIRELPVESSTKQNLD